MVSCRFLFWHIYGAAQDAQKPDFLAELFKNCENEDLPKLVGGDFSIIRREEEKNNSAGWPFIFNAVIESLSLREMTIHLGKPEKFA